MPNIKSQKKRVLTNNKANAVNSAKRTRVRNSVKAFKLAATNNEIVKAEGLLRDTISLINRAKSDGIYPANTASRKISRLNIVLDKAKALQA